MRADSICPYTMPSVIAMRTMRIIAGAATAPYAMVPALHTLQSIVMLTAGKHLAVGRRPAQHQR
jgi:hypothetical protein